MFTKRLLIQVDSPYLRQACSISLKEYGIIQYSSNQIAIPFRGKGYAVQAANICRESVCRGSDKQKLVKILLNRQSICFSVKHFPSLQGGMALSLKIQLYRYRCIAFFRESKQEASPKDLAQQCISQQVSKKKITQKQQYLILLLAKFDGLKVDSFGINKVNQNMAGIIMVGRWRYSLKAKDIAFAQWIDHILMFGYISVDLQGGGGECLIDEVYWLTYPLN